MDKKKSIVAYFDFDGTLTYHDTLMPFFRYVVGNFTVLINLPYLLAIALRYLCKNLTNEQAKQLTLTRLLKGKSLKFIEHKAKNFAQTKLHKYINPVVYAKLEWHREHQSQIILVSANLAIYLRYWCQLHKIDGVIATEIEVVNGLVTGKLATRNCYAQEKVNRIQKFLSQHNLQFDYIFAYGNSAGDYQMLNMANEGYLIKGEYIGNWKHR